MKLLVDTQVLIWLMRDESKLKPHTLDTLADPDHDVFVSVASLWEMAIKRGSGRLTFNDEEVDQVLEYSRMTELRIERSDVLLAGNLPLNHKDPFDRLLVAQASGRGMTFVTSDNRISSYNVAILWA